MRTAGRLACWSLLANGPLMARRSLATRNEARFGVGIMALTWVYVMERVTRIELALSAWEYERTRPSSCLSWHVGCPLVTAAPRPGPGLMAR
jgi:hypothetical protein